ncbi:unnamed protein product [Closterium sp. NIES-53]
MSLTLPHSRALARRTHCSILTFPPPAFPARVVITPKHPRLPRLGDRTDLPAPDACSCQAGAISRGWSTEEVREARRVGRKSEPKKGDVPKSGSVGSAERNVREEVLKGLISIEGWRVELAAPSASELNPGTIGNPEGAWECEENEWYEGRRWVVGRVEEVIEVAAVGGAAEAMGNDSSGGGGGFGAWVGLAVGEEVEGEEEGEGEGVDGAEEVGEGTRQCELGGEMEEWMRRGRRRAEGEGIRAYVMRVVGDAPLAARMGNSSGRRRGSGRGKSTLTWQDSMEEADWTTLSSSSAPLSSPASPSSSPPLPPVEHLIPLEAAILVAAHPHRAALTIAPPPGLLDLGWQAVRLHALRPKLLAFCAQLAEQQQQQQQRHSASRLTAPFTPPNSKTPCTTPAPPVMPTIRQLIAAGRRDLIADISAAGGQLAVAQALGFAARRRPTGFWEDLGNVDEEIEAFVARCWVVECGDTESRQEEAEGGKGEGPKESSYLGRVRLRNFLSGEVLSSVLRDEEAERAAMAAAAAAARAVALALAASRARRSAAAEGDESGGGTDAADDHSSGGDGSAVTGDTAAGETAEPSFSELLQRATRWPSDTAATAFTSSGSSSSSTSESTGSIGWEAEGSFSSGSGGSSRSVFDDGQGLVVASVEGSAVMPRVRDVVGAGRYDLHHAIVLHGGYRLVARELGRESGCWGGLESVVVRWEGGTLHPHTQTHTRTHGDAHTHTLSHTNNLAHTDTHAHSQSGGSGSDESSSTESSNGGSSSGGNGRLRRRVGRGARQQMLEATAGRVRALMLTHGLATFPTSSKMLALAASPANPRNPSEESGSQDSPCVEPHAAGCEGEQLVASERRSGGSWCAEECASASASAVSRGPAGAWEGEQLVAAVRRSGGPGAVADYLGVRLSKRGRGHWADEHVAAAAVRSFLLRHWGLLPPSHQPPSSQQLTPHPTHQPSSQPLTPPQLAHSPPPPLTPPDPLLEWDEEEERAVWEEAVRGGVVERQGRGFPTDVQLAAAGRLDVRYILRKFGREAIAQALGAPFLVGPRRRGGGMGGEG